MCLQTTWKKPKIAEEDIVVYKILEELYSCLQSPFSYYIWNLNKLYETEIQFTDDDSCFDDIAVDAKEKCIEDIKSIGQGFHSALTIERLNDVSGQEEFNYAVFKCIIPKGSEYYIGLSDLVVSNRIIIKEKI